ncbi:MAG: hypothetical protein HY517_03145 [Candidatus Aenigmarchaeota archaeon]|nr:hypothetical protein [Candidatus Aenigmarchaeota archaeon]
MAQKSGNTKKAAVIRINYASEYNDQLEKKFERDLIKLADHLDEFCRRTGARGAIGKLDEQYDVDVGMVPPEAASRYVEEARAMFPNFIFETSFETFMTRKDVVKDVYNRIKESPLKCAVEAAAYLSENPTGPDIEYHSSIVRAMNRNPEWHSYYNQAVAAVLAHKRAVAADRDLGIAVING